MKKFFTYILAGVVLAGLSRSVPEISVNVHAESYEEALEDEVEQELFQDDGLQETKSEAEDEWQPNEPDGFESGQPAETGGFENPDGEENAGFLDGEELEKEAEKDEFLSEGNLEEETHEFVLSVEDGADLTEALNQLLIEAGQCATAENPCKVIIPPGNYQLTGTIRTYSNIHLYAVGATITKTSPNKHIILRLGNSAESAGGYDGYENVTIEGGVWDLNYESVENKAGGTGYVGFRLGHARHVIVKNVTFLNNLKSHFLEIAGVKDVLVTGCTFSGYWEGYMDGGQECIQLDACMDYIFPGYLPFDGTACEDVVISGNVFEHVFAGVGSHSMVYGRPYRNITVSDNTFRDVKKRAVWFLNYENSRVLNNRMEGVGAGVYVRSVHDKNTHTLPDSGDSLQIPGANAEILVSGNQIRTNGVCTINGALWRSYGVSVYGGKMLAGKEGAPAGVYKMSSVQIMNNTITGNSDGILLYNAEDCTLGRNAIESDLTSDYAGSGISLSSSKRNLVQKNIISGCSSGILVGTNSAASTDNTILSNRITGSGEVGILLNAGSDQNQVSGNKILNSSGNGIHIYNCRDNTVDSNKISGSGKNGVYAGKALLQLSGNHIDTAYMDGIQLYKSDVRAMQKNHLTKNRRYGIYARAAKVKGMKLNVIRENGSSRAIRISENSTGIENVSKAVIKKEQFAGKLWKFSGTATGGKYVTFYVEKQGKEDQLGKVSVKSNRYSASVKKQKKGRVLTFRVTDKYKNTVFSTQTAK